MANLRRKKAHIDTKKMCRVCNAKKADWVVTGQGYEGSYCTDCLKIVSSKFKEERYKTQIESQSEAEWSIGKRYNL